MSVSLLTSLPQNCLDKPPKIDNIYHIELEDADHQKTLGGVDMDVLDMTLYDSYRQLDRQSYSQEYMLKCRSKLISKVRQYREYTNHLQKQNKR